MNDKINCIRHVKEWGAVATQRIEYVPETIQDLNAHAINLGLQAVSRAGGGELHLGPGVYQTNAPVGFDVEVDTNVGITIRGYGMFPTMIWSVNMDEPCIRFHTTDGNIRSILLENIVLRGGRHNLSLHKAAYNRFNNIVFWGGKERISGDLVNTEWGVHSYMGQQNQFNHCWFYELGGSNTDSALLWSSNWDTFNHCTYGENGGGIVQYSGNIAINGGTGYGAWYKGNIGRNWLVKDNDKNHITADPGLDDNDPPAFFSTIGGDASVNGLIMGLGQVFITAKSAYGLLVNGCRIKSCSSPGSEPGVDFKGFINVVANPNKRLALLVNGNSFHVRAREKDGAIVGDTGYIIQQPTRAPFTGCVVTGNIFSADPDATMVPLSTSAPSLLDPGNKNVVANAIKANQPY